MRKLLLGLAALALAVPAVKAADPPPFSVTPGFVVTPPAAKAKAAGCGCTDCTCDPGDCPGQCVTSRLAAANPRWFAVKITVELAPDAQGNRRYAIGSGTPIHCEGGKTLILTNAHVARQDRGGFKVHVPDGGTYAARRVDGSNVTDTTDAAGRVVDLSFDGPDLAFLEVDAELGRVQIAAGAPAPGDTVWQFGYGGGVGPTVKSGTVYVPRTNQPVQPTLCSTIDCIQGDSGSGVFNKDGHLVAVSHLTSYRDAYGRPTGPTHMAIPVATVRAFAASRTVLQRLFPRLADRMQAREGKVDPLSPPPAAPAPKAAPAAPKAAAPSDPFNLAADGWTYRGNGVWTKVTGVAGNAASPCPNGQCPAPASAGRYYRVR